MTMLNQSPIVIIGGGHAAAQLCAALIDAKCSQPIHLVCAEATLPYHRPPLSKAFIKSFDTAVQYHRARAWFDDAGIHVHLLDAAVKIHREQKQVTLQSGNVLNYATLVLATGTRPRSIDGLKTNLENVYCLRTLNDAERVRQAIHHSSSMTLLGGGFIGLELAATAKQLGKEVKIFEAAPRLLSRSCSTELSKHVHETHQAAGIHIELSAQLKTNVESAPAFEIEKQRLKSISIDGMQHQTELLLLGIGAIPETELANFAGLHCDNGVVVDWNLRTSDKSIFAIGDCANFPVTTGAGFLRLESVQNANDQAKYVANLIVNNSNGSTSQTYSATPWFWSEQGSMRLQIAGIYRPELKTVKTSFNPSSFTLRHFEGDSLVSVESVNAPADHMAARKQIGLNIASSKKQ
jgi:3-phenylpropionate/trans-cinnamate dioxygenase ferredoxin reductase component